MSQDSSSDSLVVWGRSKNKIMVDREDFALSSKKKKKKFMISAPIVKKRILEEKSSQIGQR